jgi:ppGpp synthetase/RelA/SpoT-type nucleotidyltranferase
VILGEVLVERGVNYHSISSRAKLLDSYKLKASRYKNPRNEIMDMAGVRIITYTQSDANRVADLIKEIFSILPRHSVDKAAELGVDRVGYRSIHFVGTLGAQRQRLPENRVFAGMCFEVQVRTILQHAWAEFEHDRNYKFAGVLPTDIKRRVSILAGSLELIDREFDTIAKNIDNYSQAAVSGNLAVPIDSTSLKAYLSNKFPNLRKQGLAPSFYSADKQIIDELHALGINTLRDLDNTIPPNFSETVSGSISAMGSFVGLLRTIMIVHDPENYFRKAWKHHWEMVHYGEVELFRQFGIDFRKYAKRYRIMLPEDLKKSPPRRRKQTHIKSRRRH